MRSSRCVLFGHNWRSAENKQKRWGSRERTGQGKLVPWLCRAFSTKRESCWLKTHDYMMHTCRCVYNSSQYLYEYDTVLVLYQYDTRSTDPQILWYS